MVVRFASVLVAVCLAVLCGASQETNELPFGTKITPQDKSFNMTTTVNLGGLFKKGGDRMERSGDIGLEPIKGSRGFVGEIQVGAPIVRDDPNYPSNTYKVVFDTQSSITWMYDDSDKSGLVSEEEEKNPLSTPFRGAVGKRYYDAKKSKTMRHYERSETNCVQAYPDGAQYMGGSVQEKLCIGSCYLYKKKIGLVSKVNNLSQHERDWAGLYDGSVGLGLSHWETGGLSYIFNQITRKKTMSFAFYIDPNMSGGVITLGGYNEKLADNNLRGMMYTNTINVKMVKQFNGAEPKDSKITSADVWGVTFKMSVDSKKNVYNYKEIKALVETTIPYGLVVPSPEDMQDLATDMEAELTTNNELMIPCKKRRSLPLLTFQVEPTNSDGAIFDMTFNGLEYFPVEVEMGRCMGFFTLRQNNRGLEKGLWGIGQRFIKKYSMEFVIPSTKTKRANNAAFPQIGFTQAEEEALPKKGRKNTKKGRSTFKNEGTSKGEWA